MGKGKEQILPTVVVEIVHAESPAGQLTGSHQQSGPLRIIVETIGTAAIVKQQKRIIDNSGDNQIGLPIVVQIAKIGAHSGDCVSILAERHSGLETHFLEFSAAQIMKQEPTNRIRSEERRV